MRNVLPGITLGVVFFLFMHDVLFFVFSDEMRHASLGKDMWRSMTRMVMCKKLEWKTRQVFQLQLLVLMTRCQRLLASILCGHSYFIFASFLKKSTIFLKVSSLNVTGPCCPPDTVMKSTSLPFFFNSSEKYTLWQYGTTLSASP